MLPTRLKTAVNCALFSALTCIPIAQASSLHPLGFEQVRIGMTAKQALNLLQDYQADEMSAESPDCYYLYSPERDDRPAMMVIDNIVVRMDVWTEQVITEQGIHVGSSKAEVLAKYPKVTVSPHPYMAPSGEYLETWLDSGNGYIFETENDVITSFRLGNRDAVYFIEGCS